MRSALRSLSGLGADLWLVHDPERLRALLREVSARVQGMGLDEIEARMGAAGVQDDARGYTVEDGVAVIQLVGEVVPVSNWLLDLFGFVGAAQLTEAVRTAQDDPEVRSLFIHVDSPGGLVGGVRELHTAIRDSAKPVHAHTSNLAASAGYWPIAGADRITASETALIGSIGTLMRVIDVSKAFDEQGLSVEVLRSSPAKGAPVRGEPVSEVALGWRQDYVDDVAAMFFADVRAGRGLDDDAWGALGDPGQAWGGRRAVELGLVDATETLEVAMGAARTAGEDDDVGVPSFNINAPAAAQETSMNKEELEALKARLAALEADNTKKDEAIASATKRATEAEAVAKIHEANAKAAEEKRVADAKAALIEQAKTEGKITGANEPAIKAAAEVLDEEKLKALLGTMPVLVKAEAVATTETKEPKADDLSEEEKADLAEIRAQFGFAPEQPSTDSFSFTALKPVEKAS